MDIDRQTNTSYHEIHRGHMERYRFAMSKVYGYVLDCACGNGYGSYMLQEANTSVTGVDIEPEAIKAAHEHFPGPDYCVGDAREVDGIWTKSEFKFDWVVSFETIEHITEPEKAIRAFRECGKNLIISTPNERLQPWQPWDHSESKYPHQRHFTPKEFYELLNDNGWDVVEKWGQENKKSPVTQCDGVFLVWVCK